MQIGDFAPRITLRSTASRVVMIGVITGVGFLIHLYATGYMAGEGGLQPLLRVHESVRVRDVDARARRQPARAVLRVGRRRLCSYLLIGFFHDDPENGYAARKAFVVTRVGDVAFALGLVPAVSANSARSRSSQVLRRRARRMARRLDDVHRDRATAARRRGRQVGAAAAADLVARRDGGPDAGLRADPCGNDGDGGRVSDRADARSLPALAGRAVRRRGRRRARRSSSRLRARWRRTTSNASSRIRR